MSGYKVKQVSDEEADKYFNSRPEGSKIGTWASKQSSKLKTREEYVVAMTAMGEMDNLIIHTDKRRTILKADEQEYYIGERGRRGSMLKRGFRNVVRISSEIS